MVTTDAAPPRVMVINRAKPAGFFSDFTWILSGFAQALENGSTPYVPSRDEEALLGQEVNWQWDWNDFFLQPISDINPHLGRLHHLDPYTHPTVTPRGSQLSNLLAAFQRNSGLRPEIEELLASISSALAPHRTLGIHFRAGDMRWAPAHPTPPSQALMLNLVRREVATGEYDSIYIASTQDSFIRSVVAKFPSVTVKSSHQTAQLLGRQTDPDFSRLLVLADAYMLGRCEKLIHSASNVAFAAKLLSSPKLRSATEINLGVNHPRLPLALAFGTLLWPIYSRKRALSAKLETTSRSSWGI